MRQAYNLACQPLTSMIEKHVSFTVLSADKFDNIRRNDKPQCNTLLLDNIILKVNNSTIPLPAIKLMFHFQLTEKEQEELWLMLFYSLWGKCIRLIHYMNEQTHHNQAQKNRIINKTTCVLIFFREMRGNLKKQYKFTTLYDNTAETKLFHKTISLLNDTIISHQCFLSHLENNTKIYRHSSLIEELNLKLNSYLQLRNGTGLINMCYNMLGDTDLKNKKVTIVSMLLQHVNKVTENKSEIDEDSISQIYFFIKHALNIILTLMNNKNQTRPLLKLSNGTSCAILKEYLDKIKLNFHISKPLETESHQRFIAEASHILSNNEKIITSPVITSSDNSPYKTESDNERLSYTHNPILGRQISISCDD